MLVVDDDAEYARALARLIQQAGLEATSSTDPVASLARVVADPGGVDAILLDIDMPEMNGLDLLAQVRAEANSPAVIMLSGTATAAAAAAAFRRGAFDYLTKPVSNSDLIATVTAAIQYTELQRQSRRGRPPLIQGELIGRSAAMRSVLSTVEALANTDVGVLILGESGSGKEVIARVLHHTSNRREHAFVALNCSAIPESLIDSELFGHSKGAFTGAHAARAGVFVEADRGTLFLDEIGDMPLPVQTRLLRVLQEREIRSVGGQGTRTIDVRVVAATHVDLQKAVTEGRFRADLYYRLNVVSFPVPPLRDRRYDLPLLIAHFLTTHGGEHPPRLSPTAFRSLVAYDWPGNVRELENTLLGAMALCAGDTIEVSALPRRIWTADAAFAPVAGPDSGEGPEPLADAKRRATVEFERTYLRRLLEETHGNVAEAARRAGLDRSNFRRRIHRLGIVLSSFRGSDSGE
ncbi:MAG: sigma-54 dependent transcriptional regulator [Deltaproteobacteria bacterium]|nr:sigma-54 dependent transcriptional regulator [Deltaproteobacteria bacterium]